MAGRLDNPKTWPSPIAPRERKIFGGDIRRSPRRRCMPWASLIKSCSALLKSGLSFDRDIERPESRNRHKRIRYRTKMHKSVIIRKTTGIKKYGKTNFKRR